MAMREIDETEYVQMRNLVGTLGKMMAHPQARGMVLQAQKTVNPDAVIPEIDAAAPLKAAQDDIRKMIEEDRAERKREREEREEGKRVSEFTNRWEAKKKALREDGYSTEYVEGVEKLAQERGLADLDAAAALFDRLNPPPTVAAPGGGNWDIFGNADKGAEDEFMKKLWDTRGESDGVVLAEAGRAISEIRGANRR